MITWGLFITVSCQRDKVPLACPSALPNTSHLNSGEERRKRRKARTWFWSLRLQSDDSSVSVLCELWAPGPGLQHCLLCCLFPMQHRLHRPCKSPPFAAVFTGNVILLPQNIWPLLWGLPMLAISSALWPSWAQVNQEKCANQLSVS